MLPACEALAKAYPHSRSSKILAVLSSLFARVSGRQKKGTEANAAIGALDSVRYACEAVCPVDIPEGRKLLWSLEQFAVRWGLPLPRAALEAAPLVRRPAAKASSTRARRSGAIDDGNEDELGQDHIDTEGEEEENEGGDDGDQEDKGNGDEKGAMMKGAPGRSRKRQRLRSRNAFIDEALLEEDGKDSYADLEDFIIPTSKGRKLLRMRRSFYKD
jgi:hypothetical protein